MSYFLANHTLPYLQYSSEVFSYESHGFGSISEDSYLSSLSVSIGSDSIPESQQNIKSTIPETTSDSSSSSAHHSSIYSTIHLSSTSSVLDSSFNTTNRLTESHFSAFKSFNSTIDIRNSTTSFQNIISTQSNIHSGNNSSVISDKVITITPSISIKSVPNVFNTKITISPSLSKFITGANSTNNSIENFTQTSTSIVPSSSSSSSTTPSTLSNYYTTATPVSSDSELEDYSISENKSNIYIIYTQTYVISGPSTFFTTDLLQTTHIRKQNSINESSPSMLASSHPPITTDFAYYNNMIKNACQSLSSSNKGTIAGSVVGSVVGFLLICLLAFIYNKRRNNSNNSGIGRKPYSKSGFSHQTGKKSTIDEEEEAGSYRDVVDINTPGRIRNNRYLNPFTTENHSQDPPRKVNAFQNEFDFGKRQPPQAPAPRKTNHNNYMNEKVPTTQSNQETSGNNGLIRNSVASSSIQSSDLGSTSTSSSSITFDPFVSSGHINNSSQGNPSEFNADEGFFRELF